MKARTFRARWKGREGEQTEYLLTSSPIGPRVIVQRWIDTNEVIVRAVDGDAWKNRRPFKEYFSVTLRDPTSPELELAVDTARDKLPAREGQP